jgi:metal-dependent amidase/aminoacylase/carboxypeptidase family protein
VDPIVVSAQIITALQTVVSRQVDLIDGPAVVSLGMIQGGVRGNIIPDSVVMLGTIRTLHPAHREEVHRRVRQTAERIAEASGALADVMIGPGVPVTYNDPALTERMASTLRRVAKGGNATVMRATTTAEDFSFFQETIPGLYFRTRGDR